MLVFFAGFIIVIFVMLILMDELWMEEVFVSILFGLLAGLALTFVLGLTVFKNRHSNINTHDLAPIAESSDGNVYGVLTDRSYDLYYLDGELLIPLSVPYDQADVTIDKDATEPKVRIIDYSPRLGWLYYTASDSFNDQYKITLPPNSLITGKQVYKELIGD